MTDPPATEARDPVATAADALYGAGLGEFVAERKRLADARKAAGDKAGAAALGKLARPSMSAWVVNRLWREVRADVDDLLAAGDRVRAGELGAVELQRALLARLRARAAAVLVGDGHAASPATLQRIATTLQALSAVGTWAPDRPGQLIADRDPPGFDVMMGAVLEPVAAAAPAVADDERTLRRAAERAALAQAATRARRELDERTAERDRARIEVEAAETALARAQARCAAADAEQATAATRAAAADAALAALAADDDR